jgi:D-alanine-D-alanine ligase
MLNGRGELFVLEVNTIPGLTANSLLPKAAKAAGLSMSDLCVRMVEMALARRPLEVTA